MKTRLERKIDVAIRRLSLTADLVCEQRMASMPCGNGIGLAGRGKPMLIVWGKEAVDECYKALCKMEHPQPTHIREYVESPVVEL